MATLCVCAMREGTLPCVCVCACALCRLASPPPFFFVLRGVVSTYLHVLAIGGGGDDLFLAVELTQVCGCLFVMQPIDPKTAVTTQAPGYAMFF